MNKILCFSFYPETQIYLRQSGFMLIIQKYGITSITHSISILFIMRKESYYTLKLNILKIKYNIKMELQSAYHLVLNNIKKLSYNDRQWLLYYISRLGEKLDRNIVVCGNCNSILESKYGHDFVKCNCEFNTFVDGGRAPFGGRYSVTPDTQHFKNMKDAIAYSKRNIKM